MTWSEISAFLNISEESARLLADRGVLPGSPCEEDGWSTNREELEGWYVNLTGAQWAELVSNGTISPLEGVGEVHERCSLADVLSALESWERREIVEIMPRPEQAGECAGILIRVKEARRRGREYLDSLESSGPYAESSAARSACEDIRLVSQCERIVGDSTVVVRLSQGGKLALRLEDPMTDLPERDREIIRFHLASYARRLASEIRPGPIAS